MDYFCHRRYAFERPGFQVRPVSDPIIGCVFLCLGFPSTKHRYRAPGVNLHTSEVWHPMVQKLLVNHGENGIQHRSQKYLQKYPSNLVGMQNNNLRCNENETCE